MTPSLDNPRAAPLPILLERDDLRQAFDFGDAEGRRAFAWLAERAPIEARIDDPSPRAAAALADTDTPAWQEWLALAE